MSCNQAWLRMGALDTVWNVPAMEDAAYASTRCTGRPVYINSKELLPLVQSGAVDVRLAQTGNLVHIADMQSV